MTYQGAIDELKSFENNEFMPDWFKPALKKVRETMEMDRRETLDFIKAEIQEKSVWYRGQTYDGLCIALKIIDKYIGKESEVQE
jgi:hypothetical protein